MFLSFYVLSMAVQLNYYVPENVGDGRDSISKDVELSSNEMFSSLTEIYGWERIITRGPWGSVRMEPKENDPLPTDIVLEWPAAPNPFLNTYRFNRIFKDENWQITKKPYFGYFRGKPEDILNPNISHAKATGIGVIVVYKDSFGKEWVHLLEEFRPLDAWSKNNLNSRTYGIVLWLVWDENEGESVMDACRRELIEETGLQMSTFEIMGRSSYLSVGAGNEQWLCACTTVQSLAPALWKDGVPVKALTDRWTTRAWYWVPVAYLEEWMDSMDEQGFTAWTGISSLWVRFPRKKYLTPQLIWDFLSQADPIFLQELREKLEPKVFEVLSWKKISKQW